MEDELPRHIKSIDIDVVMLCFNKWITDLSNIIGDYLYKPIIYCIGDGSPNDDKIINNFKPLPKYLEYKEFKEYIVTYGEEFPHKISDIFCNSAHTSGLNPDQQVPKGFVSVYPWLYHGDEVKTYIGAITWHKVDNDIILGINPFAYPLSKDCESYFPKILQDGDKIVLSFNYVTKFKIDYNNKVFVKDEQLDKLEIHDIKRDLNYVSVETEIVIFVFRNGFIKE